MVVYRIRGGGKVCLFSFEYVSVAIVNKTDMVIDKYR